MSVHKTTIIHWYDFDSWKQCVYVNDPHGNKTAMQYAYMVGKIKPNYPMPTTIGFTADGHYQFDTRIRMDGMPLHRGYVWSRWWATSPFKR